MTASPAESLRIERSAADDDALFDVAAAAWTAARKHRIALSPESELEGQSADAIVRDVLATVEAPRQ